MPGLRRGRGQRAPQLREGLAPAPAHAKKSALDAMLEDGELALAKFLRTTHAVERRDDARASRLGSGIGARRGELSSITRTSGASKKNALVAHARLRSLSHDRPERVAQILRKFVRLRNVRGAVGRVVADIGDG
jgi:hypothetical protein